MQATPGAHLVSSHSGGMSMVRTLELFGEPVGCITQVCSRGRTAVGDCPLLKAALAAPSKVWSEQLTSCTTRCDGGIGVGTGKPARHGSSGAGEPTEPLEVAESLLPPHPPRWMIPASSAINAPHRSRVRMNPHEVFLLITNFLDRK